MSRREAIEELFRNARAETTWKIDDVCEWTYFFYDPNPEKLLEAGNLLEEQGYQMVELLGPDEEDEEAEVIFCLAVIRNEIHSVDTLYQRDLELVKFAEEQGLESYDGMEVGPVSDEEEEPAEDDE